MTASVVPSKECYSTTTATETETETETTLVEEVSKLDEQHIKTTEEIELVIKAPLTPYTPCAVGAAS